MMKLQIIFEDEQILVVDKPAGLVVNRSETIKEETLQDKLSAYLKLGKDLGIGGRSGIVHRLDRETSGLLLVAKTKIAFENLQDQFKERKVEKEYTALVHGLTKNKHGAIEAKINRIGKFGKFGVNDSSAIGGRIARTDFKVIRHYEFKPDCFNVLIHQYKYIKARDRYLRQQGSAYTFLSCYPKTGRTHQVRVHLKSIGHPVVSDLIYGPKKLLKFDLLWCPRLFLHAASLEFIHPKTKKIASFGSDLPKDLKDAILNLEKVSPSG